MTFGKFLARVEKARRPVVLLEGRRDLPVGEGRKLADLARVLAERLPRAIFRSGNARGSDEAIIRLIMRDTLKVVGDSTAGLAPATIGIFRENLDNSNAGGTGHTIRCCREMDVPAVLSRDWRGWRH